MNAKKIAIPVILVLGLGISLYLWSSMGSSGGDDSVMGQVQRFVCPSCKQEFSMTVEQSIAERRAKGDVFCKQCGAGGAVKQDVVIQFGGPTMPDDNDRPTGEVEEDPKKIPSGGMQPLGGD